MDAKRQRHPCRHAHTDARLRTVARKRYPSYARVEAALHGTVAHSLRRLCFRHCPLRRPIRRRFRRSCRCRRCFSSRRNTVGNLPTSLPLPLHLSCTACCPGRALGGEVCSVSLRSVAAKVMNKTTKKSSIVMFPTPSLGCSSAASQTPAVQWVSEGWRGLAAGLSGSRQAELCAR